LSSDVAHGDGMSSSKQASFQCCFVSMQFSW
jgi:hypothetical protein